MSRTNPHHDPYYPPTSSVGMVRAERPKYLGVDARSRFHWAETESRDPSSATMVDPDHEAEGAQLLLDYYEAVRFDRALWQASVSVAFFGFGSLGVLCGWLFSNYTFTLIGIAVGIVTAYAFLTGFFTLSERARDAMRAFHASEYFRDRRPLDGYLITTPDQREVWEALGLEWCRAAIDDAAGRLRAHLHLSEHRNAEIIQLQQQEQELRRRIVDMLDPQRPDTTHHLSDELRAAFYSRHQLRRLSPEGGKQK